jgi:Rrf2 family transcriptional regulator, nitric oxide-sensitive transcriptional repressor
MFSQTAMYALRAMVQLSQTAPAASSTAAIAESALVPRAYLSKVLQELRKAGLVRCRRGVGGGVSLAMPPDSITILQVVTAVEPIRRFHVNPLVGTQNACLQPLHQKLDDAFNMLEASLSDTTLAQVAEAQIPECTAAEARSAATGSVGAVRSDAQALRHESLSAAQSPCEDHELEAEQGPALLAL